VKILKRMMFGFVCVWKSEWEKWEKVTFHSFFYTNNCSSSVFLDSFYKKYAKMMINTIILASCNSLSVSWLLFTSLDHQMGSSRLVGTDFNMSLGFRRMKKDDLQIMRCACRALSPACKALHSCVSLFLPFHSLFLSTSHLVCPGVGGESDHQ